MGIKIRTLPFGSTSAKNLDVLIKKKNVVYQGLSHMPIKTLAFPKFGEQLGGHMLTYV